MEARPNVTRQTQTRTAIAREPLPRVSEFGCSMRVRGAGVCTGRRGRYSVYTSTPGDGGGTREQGDEEVAGGGREKETINLLLMKEV